MSIPTNWMRNVGVLARRVNLLPYFALWCQQMEHCTMRHYTNAARQPTERLAWRGWNPRSARNRQFGPPNSQICRLVTDLDSDDTRRTLAHSRLC